MKKLLAASCLSLALLAGGASAANILTVVGNGTDTLDANYNPTPATTGVAGVGDTVTTASASGFGLLLDDVADVTFTYLGKEAGFSNMFVDGDNVFTTGLTAAGSKFTTVSISPDAGGFLPISFKSGGVFDVVNGAGAISGASIAFKMISESLNTATYAIFLNDHGSDTDYDDMVILVEATRVTKDPGDVPLPGGVILLMSGLAGLGYMGRSRKGKKA